MDNKILVGLIEDHLLFRQGIKLILKGWDNIEVVFESSDGHSVIEKLKTSQQVPDVMLVDLFLPPFEKKEFSGKEVTEALQQHFPQMRVIILSGHQDENLITHLIESGAHGYLVKDCNPQEVYEAIEAVYTKGSYINKLTLEALQRRSRVKQQKPALPVALTKREQEILDLICKELTSEEMAEKLYISVKTVNGHRINLLEKTGTKNTAGLVVFALKNGLVEL
jgi:DNA-binding NarL/FixJ family response regulator